MMVWELLAPVNGKFLPIDVVPGGSVRLTVAQPGKAAAAAAKAVPQLKQVRRSAECAAGPACFCLCMVLVSCKPIAEQACMGP